MEFNEQSNVPKVCFMYKFVFKSRPVMASEITYMPSERNRRGNKSPEMRRFYKSIVGYLLFWPCRWENVP